VKSRPPASAFDLSLELGVTDDLDSPLPPGFTLSLGTLFTA
jgi:hypothetical protein